MYLLCNYCFVLHCKYQNSPIWESEDLDVLEYLKNFTIADTRTPSPLSSPLRESEDLDVLGDLENFTTASIRTAPSIGESEDLDVFGDLENFIITSTRTLPTTTSTSNLPKCKKVNSMYSKG